MLEILTINQMKKMYENVRRAAYGSWEGMIKSPAYMFTENSLSKQLFLQFDLTYASPQKHSVKRIIGWAHPEMMDVAKETGRNVFVDCTFRCVPKDFEQLLILMVYSKPKNYYCPVFYVLMQEKSQKAYELVFQNIGNTLGENIDAATFTCDFETALINAAKKSFGTEHTKYVLCFFHFKQAIRRKLIDIGMTHEVIVKLIGGEITRMVNEKEEKHEVQGLIDLLTVIPVNEIKNIGIPFIRSVMEEDEAKYPDLFKQFWEVYFNNTWLKRYDPNDWNIGSLRETLKSDIKIVNRTNNGNCCPCVSLIQIMSNH
jgi:hypothetical protein